ncbi:hypothetical protein L1049_022725 [Liquidambar formosana]|uniref:AUGMIN subunit 8 n=1 Tax=Liquidambar formosana TaxID=63359 RepID=A0AAP0REZ4_LIQFO
MDVYEAEQVLQKQTAVETVRPPLVPAEKNNGVTRRSKTREVSSRYKSPSPSTPSVPRRCVSPNVTRTVNSSPLLAQKRAQSAERKRPSTPPSPPRPSTPVLDSSRDILLSSKRITSSRLPESLWPSTMRSLSVSFQSDTFSIPISKREKPATHALSDRTLKPSSNVAHKQAETPAVPRKLTPERKRSPLKGKNVSDQSENSKPVDGLPTRLVDQHRWPSRTGRKVSSNTTIRSVDLADKTTRVPATSIPGNGISSMRRLSISDGRGKPLQKSASETASQLSLDERGRVEFEAYSVDDNPLRVSGLRKPVSSSSSERMTLTTTAIRSQSLPIPGSRPPSPSRTSALSSSVSRGVSPSRTRPSTPPSRGISPSRIRTTNASSQSNSSTSVLSFIADFRKGKKGTNQIEDAHQLRLLYNRCLQWRFANARAHAALVIQKKTAEKTLYNVWRTTLALWDSVIKKRINLQQLRLELKLNSVLNEQMVYLDDWAVLEGDHASSLSGAIEDLEASTVRLPVTGGAKADIETMKVAICSAVDVMQAMGSSVCSLLSRVEVMNSLVSGLADVAAQERAMLDECEALLASTAAMQVEEYSLTTHLIQFRQALTRVEQPLLEIKMPP